MPRRQCTYCCVGSVTRIRGQLRKNKKNKKKIVKRRLETNEYNHLYSMKKIINNNRLIAMSAKVIIHVGKDRLLQVGDYAFRRFLAAEVII